MNRFDRNMEPDGLASSPGSLVSAGPAVPSRGTRFDPRPYGLVDALRTWHRRARDWHERRRRYRRTVAELSALDDRVLADIGVRRVDIPAVAAGMGRRPEH